MPTRSLTAEQMQEAVDALADAKGDQTAAAKALGIRRSTLQNRLARAKDDHIVAKGTKAVPGRIGNQGMLSEDEQKFRSDWGPAECIAELRRIAGMDETKYLSRNYVRVHSRMSESTWNRYFGTFEEFKRQAHIKLSRHAHQQEKQIAKHASVDRMRDTNNEKRQYEGKWTKDKAGRWQTCLVPFDLHDIDCDPFYERVLLDVAKRMQPERVIYGGDLFDLPEFGKYDNDPREYNLLERVKWVHGHLEKMRKVVGDVQIDLVEGNHEHRLLRHLAEATPAMKTLLSDLHDFTVSTLLGLDEFEVNLVARSDLAAFRETDKKKEIARNWLHVWDSFIVHHFPEGRQMGLPGCHGHHHKYQAWPVFNPTVGSSQWVQSGGGASRRRDWCNAEPWNNGFLAIHVDHRTKASTFEYVDCTNDIAVAGGKVYYRGTSEII